jgi:hypothetical protein
MAPLPVGVADRANPQRLATEKPIDQRRLADTRRPEQRDGPRGAKVRLERGQPFVLQRADHQDIDQRQACAQRLARGRGILAKIRLVEHHDRHRSRVPHHRQVPFEPPGAEILRERGDEKDRVDIRGEDLLIHDPAGRRARHRAPPLEPAMDDRAVSRRSGPAALSGDDHTHPVADGWKVRRARRIMAESPAHLGPRFDIAGDAIQPALFLDDS